MYRYYSGAPPITAFLTISKSKNGDLLLQMIPFTQSDGANPCTTVSVSGLSVFKRTSNLMMTSMFTVRDIIFRKMVFSKLIYDLFSD